MKYIFFIIFLAVFINCKSGSDEKSKPNKVVDTATLVEKKDGIVPLQIITPLPENYHRPKENFWFHADSKHIYFRSEWNTMWCKEYYFTAHLWRDSLFVTRRIKGGCVKASLPIKLECLIKGELHESVKLLIAAQYDTADTPYDISYVQKLNRGEKAMDSTVIRQELEFKEINKLLDTE